MRTWEEKVLADTKRLMNEMEIPSEKAAVVVIGTAQLAAQIRMLELLDSIDRQLAKNHDKPAGGPYSLLEVQSTVQEAAKKHSTSVVHALLQRACNGRVIPSSAMTATEFENFLQFLKDFENGLD